MKLHELFTNIRKYIISLLPSLIKKYLSKESKIIDIISYYFNERIIFSILYYIFTFRTF